MSKLLLIDDDIELCELLSEYLQAEGFSVDVVNDGSEASEQAQKVPYELLILDVMLPGKSGFDVLRELRSASYRTPVIMLTAKGDDVDRIVGLEMGADDYLPKPCNPRELVARIRAILRRSDNQADDDKLLSSNGIEIHPHSREVYLNGEQLELTSSEYNILLYLIQRQGKVVSKSELTEKALHRKLTAYDRSIDMHVSNLRNKLQQTDADTQRIKTIRGIGYMLIDE